MAKISIDVDTNFAEASAEMKKFGGVLSTESEKYKNLIKKYDSTAINTLIEKNRRLAASISATNGPQKAAIEQQRALSKEIKKLVSEGLDPNGDELRELREEYQRVTVSVNDHIKANNRLKDAQKKSANENRKKLKQVEEAEKSLQKSQKQRAEAQKRNAQMIRNAYLVIGAAAAGVVAKTIQSASQMEDIAASFEPLVGGAERATELVEKLNQTAATTPFQIEGIAKAAGVLLPAMNGDLDLTVERFRMIGDTAGGNAEKMTRISAIYSRALLKNKVEMGDINQLAEKGIPIYSELSESMGISVEELTKMASQGKITGDDLTKVFQKMTSEGGVFFRGMDIASRTVTGRFSTMKDNVNLLSAEFGSKLLPMVGNTADAVTKFIQAMDPEQVDQFGDTVALVFKAILISGGVVAKGINDVFALMNKSIDDNVRNSFFLVNKFSDFVATQAESWYTVLDFLGADVEGLGGMANNIRDFQVLMDQSEQNAKENTENGILAWEKRNAVIVDYIKTIDEAIAKEGTVGGGEETPVGDGFPVGVGGETPEQMREKMRLLTEEELLGYDARAEALLHFFDDQILSREDFNARMEELRSEDVESEREAARAKLSITSDVAGGLSNLFGAISDTRAKESKSRRALLVVEKALALSEIGINTGVGISKALASAAPPVNFINAGLVGANGVAAGIKVANTPIPSAETGADFIVPDTRTSRVDNVAVNAQPGERVTVEPRGEESTKMMSIVLEVDGRVLARSTQNYIDNGQIRITTDNVRRAG